MKRQFFFLLVIMSFTSCREDEPMWYDNEYVFLEQHESVYSDFVEGYEGNLPRLMVDFPMYKFDPDTRELGGVLYGEDYSEGSITSNTKLLLGMGGSHSGVASGGAGTSLHEVHEFPIESGSLTVINIEEDGTINCTYNDVSMTLAPYKKWSVYTSKFDTIYLEGYGEQTGLDLTVDTVIIEWTYTDRLTNWGFLEKDQFINWKDRYEN